ncbi:MAG: protein translocase subunit SecD [Sphingomonadales bacterium]|nr:protein translocase subunit SecD [Sphingomonadales bacterium]
MRLKGFFWFLSILLTAVCVYQLSFTWVASNVETKAAKEADLKVKMLQDEAKSNNGKAILPNGTPVDFNNPEAVELAKAAFLNEILREKGEKPVYPVLGSTFAQVKKMSLAFGLDLVGGMSVTVEISYPDLIRGHVKSVTDPKFTKPFNRAVAAYNRDGGDFIATFISAYKKANGALPLSYIIRGESIGIKTTDAEVENYLRDLVASSMKGIEDIIGRRINQFGVAQPNIQRDLATNRLYIELPGVQDEETVSRKIRSTANLEFYETYMPEQIQTQWKEAARLSKLNEIVIDDLAIADTTATDTTATTQDTAAETVAVNPQSTISNASKKSLADYVTPVGGYAIGYVSATEKANVDAILRRKDIKNAFPPELKFMWSAKPESIDNKTKKTAYFLYACRIPDNGKARVRGEHVNNAKVDYDQTDGSIIVSLSMTDEGTNEWGRMTTENKDRIIAISMDSVVYSAPRVINAITNGNTQISGSFTFQEAEDLAGLLNGGALPVPCVIKDLQKVGPTIGAENSKAGLISFGVAFIAVLLYMMFYYGKAGQAANIALIVNVVFIFGSLASFGAVLTLAGIAGIVLTIGTAVDANILIFERVREEQAIGADTETAISTGFRKALPSIIDANVTHLLVAIILKIFGTGEIESFATTLIIGIFTSMFSAMVIAELAIHSWLSKGKAVGFSTKYSQGLFQNFNFDWMGKRKFFYAFSIIVTIAGIISLSTRGLKQSVEFTGGRTFAVKFEKKADIEVIRKELSKVFVENGETASIDLKTKSNDYNVEIVTNYLLNNDGATDQVNDQLKAGLEACQDQMGSYDIQESRAISASISSELWTSSTIAITLALLAIFAYILIRFGHWQYSLGAIVGLAHDAFFVISIFSLLHGYLPFTLDVNQAFIAAILTVIGYSMNDTVIVFDRIRENLRKSKVDDNHGDIINSSLNRTLSRTFNTSMILFVVVLIMFIFGGPAIKGFLFALLVGVLIGTYSSLCVATPILLDFSKRLRA